MSLHNWEGKKSITICSGKLTKLRSQFQLNAVQMKPKFSFLGVVINQRNQMLWIVFTELS
jgi:hypothetical protein